VTIEKASRVLLAIATAGRRQQISLTLEQLARLNPLPVHVIIVPASPEDFDRPQNELPFPLTVIPARSKGLTAQRNMVIDAITAGLVVEAEILLFIDDDFYPCRNYIGAVDEAFRKRPDAVGFSGRPILDGATGPGVTHEDAVRAVRQADELKAPEFVEATYGAYGCNMSFSILAIKTTGARFDEHLPLYGWLEDVDFSRQVAHHGAILRSSQLRGVHLGTKSGRVSGRRLGYSQIANPAFCVSKGTMSRSFALKQMFRNVAKNLFRVLLPEAWIDRQGRLSGNLQAIGDWVRGNLHPLNVTRM